MRRDGMANGMSKRQDDHPARCRVYGYRNQCQYSPEKAFDRCVPKHPQKWVLWYRTTVHCAMVFFRFFLEGLDVCRSYHAIFWKDSSKIRILFSRGYRILGVSNVFLAISRVNLLFRAQKPIARSALKRTSYVDYIGETWKTEAGAFSTYQRILQLGLLRKRIFITGTQDRYNH